MSGCVRGETLMRSTIYGSGRLGGECCCFISTGANFAGNTSINRYQTKYLDSLGSVHVHPKAKSFP